MENWWYAFSLFCISNLGNSSWCFSQEFIFYVNYYKFMLRHWRHICSSKVFEWVSVKDIWRKNWILTYLMIYIKIFLNAYHHIHLTISWESFIIMAGTQSLLFLILSSLFWMLLPIFQLIVLSDIFIVMCWLVLSTLLLPGVRPFS